MSDYPIRVLGGLPAIARVHRYYPYVPATWHHPSEGPELDWELLDRRGKTAPWIERKLTRAEIERIETDLYERCGDEYRRRDDDD